MKEDIVNHEAEILRLTMLVKNTQIVDDFERLQMKFHEQDKQIMQLKEDLLKQEEKAINYQHQVEVLNNMLKMQKLDEKMRIESLVNV